MSAKSKAVVLVTAIGGAGYGEQILKALLLAKNDCYKIIGADVKESCSNARYVEQYVQLPVAGDSGYIETLKRVIAEHGVNVVLHGCEPEMAVLSKHREEIEKLGVFLPINSPEFIELCLDKQKTNRKLSELGFNPPRFKTIESKDDIELIDWYPVVVKPSIGGGGSANVYIAQNPKELLGLADYLHLYDTEMKFFVQEYAGIPEHEYTVGVLLDMKGNYINSIGLKRDLTSLLSIRVSYPNRTGRTDLGKRLVISSGISQGYINRFPEVTRKCRDIAVQLGAKGSINIQCRLVNDVIRVFEINPRFSGTTSLRAMAGYNEPDILIRKQLFSEEILTDFKYKSMFITRNLQESILWEDKNRI